MRAKIIMDSGKEYKVQKQDVHTDDFIHSLYNGGKTPVGNKLFVAEKQFIILEDEYKTFINPANISSIEIIENW